MGFYLPLAPGQHEHRISLAQEHCKVISRLNLKAASLHIVGLYKPGKMCAGDPDTTKNEITLYVLLSPEKKYSCGNIVWKDYYTILKVDRQSDFKLDLKIHVRG